MAFSLIFNGKALFFYKKNFDGDIPSKYIHIINCHLFTSLSPNCLWQHYIIIQKKRLPKLVRQPLFYACYQNIPIFVQNFELKYETYKSI